MNLRRIVAKTSREAMRKLRDELGADAIILSNRQVDGGVEIMALPSDEIAALAPPAMEKKAAAPEPVPPPAAVVAEQPAMPQAAFDGAGLAQSVIAEIRNMQSRLETQLGELAWRDLPRRDPGRASVVREMLAAGFSAALASRWWNGFPRATANRP